MIPSMFIHSLGDSKYDSVRTELYYHDLDLSVLVPGSPEVAGRSPGPGQEMAAPSIAGNQSETSC